MELTEPRILLGIPRYGISSRICGSVGSIDPIPILMYIVNNQKIVQAIVQYFHLRSKIYGNVTETQVRSDIYSAKSERRQKLRFACL